MKVKNINASLKEFRKSHGFTQDEMAALLNISRSLLAMVEKIDRSLPDEAEKKFIALQNLLSTNNFKPKGSEEYINEEMEKFKKACHSKIIDMQYAIHKLRRSLGECEVKREGLIYTAQFWEYITDQGIEFDNDQITLIKIRIFSKLEKMKLSQQLLNELEIKILSAGVDVLEQFIADNHLSSSC